jgi:peptidoglycan/LPS O-acetylase OafA/YrhL
MPIDAWRSGRSPMRTRPLRNSGVHVNVSRQRGWVATALCVGVVYLLIGRVFAVPVDHPRAWRLAAWLLSGGVYAGHVGYERFGLHHSPRATALHAALAVAVGSFTLAVAGAIHTLSATANAPALVAARAVCLAGCDCCTGVRGCPVGHIGPGSTAGEDRRRVTALVTGPSWAQTSLDPRATSL